MHYINISKQDASLLSRRGLGKVICPYMEGTPNTVDSVIRQLQKCTYLCLFLRYLRRKNVDSCGIPWKVTLSFPFA